MTMNMSRNQNSIAIDRSAALNSASSFLHNKVRPSAGLGSTYSRYQANAARQSGNNNQPYGRALTVNLDRSSQGLHQGLNGLDRTSFRESELGLSVSNQGPAMMDPESSMAIGQDSGLIISLKENGFDFFVNY